MGADKKLDEANAVLIKAEGFASIPANFLIMLLSKKDVLFRYLPWAPLFLVI